MTDEEPQNVAAARLEAERQRLIARLRAMPASSRRRAELVGRLKALTEAQLRCEERAS